MYIIRFYWLYNLPSYPSGPRAMHIQCVGHECAEDVQEFWDVFYILLVRYYLFSDAKLYKSALRKRVVFIGGDTRSGSVTLNLNGPYARPEEHPVTFDVNNRVIVSLLSFCVVIVLWLNALVTSKRQLYLIWNQSHKTNLIICSNFPAKNKQMFWVSCCVTCYTLFCSTFTTVFRFNYYIKSFINVILLTAT